MGMVCLGALWLGSARHGEAFCCLKGEHMSDNTMDSVEPLADEIMALCKTSAYDDMSWAEIDKALMLASHKLKVHFMVHGTLDPSPGDNLPTGDAAASRSDEPHTNKGKRRRIFS
jgi:hypothetical protein